MAGIRKRVDIYLRASATSSEALFITPLSTDTMSMPYILPVPGAPSSSSPKETHDAVDTDNVSNTIQEKEL